MTARQPVETTNLDGYGNPALEWQKALDVLANPLDSDRFFLSTVRGDGRPHSTGIGALWSDGDMYVVSGPTTRRSQNLAANPACSIAAALKGMDLVFEGDAARVTDGPTLERVVGLYRASGWPAEVEGEGFTAPYSAPSAGAPPWYLYRVTVHTVFAVASEEPGGATRWRF